MNYKCKDCEGTGLGTYPHVCYTCGGTGLERIFENLKMVQWLKEMQDDLQEKIAKLESENNELKTKIKHLEDDYLETNIRSNYVESALVALIADSMKDEEKERFKRIIKSKGNPQLRFLENEPGMMRIEWDGLSIDEIEIKDVIT